MQITIDGKPCPAQQGEFILAIAKRNQIEIPALCHSDALPGQANCRLCLVALIENGRSRFVASCVYPVTQDLEVVTDSPQIRSMRKTIIMLLLARAPHDEYLNKLKMEYAVPETNRFARDDSGPCLLCGLCVQACEKVGPAAIATVNRGITKKIAPPYDEPSRECLGCGSCAAVCPSGAITIREEGNRRTIWNKQFELLRCQKCGAPWITHEHFRYINHKLGCANSEVLCEKCRKLLVMEKMKAIYGVVDHPKNIRAI